MKIIRDSDIYKNTIMYIHIACFLIFLVTFFMLLTCLLHRFLEKETERIELPCSAALCNKNLKVWNTLVQYMGFCHLD